MLTDTLNAIPWISTVAMKRWNTSRWTCSNIFRHRHPLLADE